MYDTLQAKAYSKAEEAAKETLKNWSDTVQKLIAAGWNKHQIERRKRQLELNTKGIFRS